jgi:flavodoxin
MKALVIYDSLYGNTQKIALAIANALGSPQDVTALRGGDVKPKHFAGLDLLIVGSPTQKFRPTTAISNLLKGMPDHSLKGVKVAAFDTRLTWNEIEKTAVLAFFVKIFGYAAKPIADRLKSKDGELILPPEGFFVDEMEGPLLLGEIDRAISWAEQISAEM